MHLIVGDTVAQYIFKGLWTVLSNTDSIRFYLPESLYVQEENFRSSKVFLLSKLKSAVDKR
jgi:hypothetical protein